MIEEHRRDAQFGSIELGKDVMRIIGAVVVAHPLFMSFFLHFLQALEVLGRILAPLLHPPCSIMKHSYLR
jgi:hypothetical protein